MYETKIKEKYRSTFKHFWWDDNGNEEFIAVRTMGNMTLLYNPGSKLLLDIYNNKLEKFEIIKNPPVIYVEAKNVQYADQFDLHGKYKIAGHTESEPIYLLLEDCENSTVIGYKMLPSRLSVVEIVENDGQGENL